ncbi:hypothetical protein K461DRAFT_279044 [Myriangium duriaei CBS 260.36]|uniref:Rhodopsin domain-containing protein n=1 Tax=Myriangium duriaei CBS 260.36 TaxID=1168546 RepID=A0A9P4J3I9_9PEZI|nr:hypothetical protein K461DRAFT_279044 [Myriangium duriaei CBS 260.36]
MVAVLLSTGSCFARLYVRKFMVGQIGKDDWLLVAAYVSFLALCGLYVGILTVTNGQGYVENYYFIIELGQFDMLLSSVVTVLIRAAIAAFFLRVFSNRGVFQQIRITIIATLAIYTVYVITIAFLTLFQCGPSIDDLDSLDANASCLNTYLLANLALGSLVLTTTSDWVMTISPIFIVWRSRMTRSQKVSTLLLLLLGAFAGVISIIRIPYNDLANTFTPADIPNYIKWFILAIAESCLGITVISLAALRPIFKSRKPKSFAQHAHIDVLVGLEAQSEAEKDGKQFGPMTFISELQTITFIEQSK